VFRLLWTSLPEYSIEEEREIAGYVVDIFFPEVLVAIEIDGPSHALRKRKDYGRDLSLADTGISVFRIDLPLPKNDRCLGDVIAFIDQQMETLEERKMKWKKYQAHWP